MEESLKIQKLSNFSFSKSKFHKKKSTIYGITTKGILLINIKNNNFILIPNNFQFCLSLALTEKNILYISQINKIVIKYDINKKKNIKEIREYNGTTYDLHFCDFEKRLFLLTKNFIYIFDENDLFLKKIKIRNEFNFFLFNKGDFCNFSNNHFYLFKRENFKMKKKIGFFSEIGKVKKIDFKGFGVFSKYGKFFFYKNFSENFFEKKFEDVKFIYDFEFFGKNNKFLIFLCKKKNYNFCLQIFDLENLNVLKIYDLSFLNFKYFSGFFKYSENSIIFCTEITFIVKINDLVFLNIFEDKKKKIS